MLWWAFWLSEWMGTKWKAGAMVFRGWALVSSMGSRSWRARPSVGVWIVSYTYCAWIRCRGRFVQMETHPYIFPVSAISFQVHHALPSTPRLPSTPAPPTVPAP